MNTDTEHLCRLPIPNTGTKHRQQTPNTDTEHPYRIAIPNTGFTTAGMFPGPTGGYMPSPSPLSNTSHPPSTPIPNTTTEHKYQNTDALHHHPTPTPYTNTEYSYRTQLPNTDAEHQTLSHLLACCLSPREYTSFPLPPPQPRLLLFHRRYRTPMPNSTTLHHDPTRTINTDTQHVCRTPIRNTVNIFTEQQTSTCW